MYRATTTTSTKNHEHHTAYNRSSMQLQRRLFTAPTIHTTHLHVSRPQPLALRAAAAVPQQRLGTQHGAGLGVHPNGGGGSGQPRYTTATTTATSHPSLSLSLSSPLAATATATAIAAQGTHQQRLAYATITHHRHWLHDLFQYARLNHNSQPSMSNAHDGIELDWIGLDWIGSDWIGLDWIGLSPQAKRAVASSKEGNDRLSY
jgi:hypothetical protein